MKFFAKLSLRITGCSPFFILYTFCRAIANQFEPKMIHRNVVLVLLPIIFFLAVISARLYPSRMALNVWQYEHEIGSNTLCLSENSNLYKKLKLLPSWYFIKFIVHRSCKLLWVLISYISDYTYCRKNRNIIKYSIKMLSVKCSFFTRPCTEILFLKISYSQGFNRSTRNLRSIFVQKATFTLFEMRGTYSNTKTLNS